MMGARPPLMTFQPEERCLTEYGQAVAQEATT